MRKALTIAGLALVATGAAMGCSSDRTVVRRETVETIPAAPVVERRTTVRTIPPPDPVVEETTTYQSGSVEQRSRTIETIE